MSIWCPSALLICFVPAVQAAGGFGESGAGTHCDLASKVPCPKAPLRPGEAHVVDNFLADDDLQSVDKIFASATPRVQQHLNHSLWEVAPPKESEDFIQSLISRIHKHAREHVIHASGMEDVSPADSPGIKPWKFQGQYFHDYHLFRRYFSHVEGKRQLEVHTDSVTQGRCLSVALNLGSEKGLSGGAFQTQRCKSESCKELYERCRARDDGNCRDMLQEDGLERVQEISYQRGRLVFFLSETMHSVSELTSGVRDILFMWMSCSPTLRVVRNGYLPAVEKALELGADVQEIDKDAGSQPLHWATEEGHVPIMQLLLSKRASVQAAAGDGSQPLHVAAAKGFQAPLDLLLERRAGIDDGSRDGSRPIHGAASAGHMSVVERLLVAGAGLHFFGQRGFEPLHSAAKGGQLAMVELLAERRGELNAAPVGIEPIHAAAMGGHTAVLAWLLQKGANLTASDDTGLQPMHEAAAEGHLGVLEFLMERGAQVNVVDREGLEPIHQAVAHDHMQAVHFLIAHRSDVSNPSNDGIAPMHFAAHSGHLALVDLLWAAGGDIRGATLDGAQPLHLAASEGHIAVAERLLSRGCEVNALAGEERQPLHGAVVTGHREMIDFLAKQKADLSAEVEGMSPSQLAEHNKHPKLAEYLADLLMEDRPDL